MGGLLLNRLAIGFNGHGPANPEAAHEAVRRGGFGSPGLAGLTRQAPEIGIDLGLSRALRLLWATVPIGQRDGKTGAPDD